MSKRRKDDGKGAQDLMSSLRGCFDEVKAKIQETENKKKLERERRKEVKDDYNKWLEKQRPEAEKAAQTILGWVDQFLASDIWREIAFSLHGLTRSVEDDKEPVVYYVDISRTIIYKGPSPNPYYLYGNQGHQSLSLDLDGNLFVHEDVKYGKSYKLKNVEDMMRYADPIVLTKVAKTMQDNSVWAIIPERLKERLTNYVSRTQDLY
ncbi:MAG: hypothetical protein Q8Q89_00175 [bacterium]|nr:hypothetical protein [bacterium]